MARQVGKVFLLGSGPGGLAYLTVQAHHILANADVLLYDALVDDELLAVTSNTCLKIDVGKRGGRPSMLQADINDLLIKYCQQRQQVVRLKSGDPFIFGRCHSEIQALQAASCDYEVIPGLSSALVAPLLAGIPLTDPVLSRCFAVLSAHDPSALNWSAIAQLETLVILMGGQQLPEIVHQLQAHRRSPQTPIAIIRWAGRPQQQLWDGTLATVLDQTSGESLSPCVIVVGEVAGLRPYLQPRYSLSDSAVTTNLTPDTRQPTPSSPLTGKTVLVTRSASQSTQFSDRLQREGATVIELPALEIVPPSTWESLDAAIARMAEFDWLILTSANSVDFFFERLATQLTDIRALASVRIAVVGEKTASRLKARGMQPDFVPPAFVADSLAAHLPGPLSGSKILFPRVESGGRDVLVKDLTARGAEVTEVAAYQSRCPDAIAPEALAVLQNRMVDVITFASSKTVKHFCQLLERSQPDSLWQPWLEGICIASIGPQTSKTCETLLGRVDAEAQEYTLDGLIQAIEGWFASES